MPRTSRGRQKIEMTKMSKESNLLVTFSKRRSGLFKKASELCTLCGAEIAIIVFSPGKKVFSFGHPSVEALVDRFLSRRPIAGNNPNPNPNPNHGAAELLEARRNLNVRDLNMQLTNFLNQLEIEKKKGDELSKIRKESAERCWWEVPTEALNVHQLEQVKVALEELKKNVVMISEKMRLEGQGVSGAPYFMGVGVGGGQSIVAFPPPVPQRGQAGVSFPPHVPPQDLNGSELGLSLTPHVYSMGYGRGHFG